MSANAWPRTIMVYRVGVISTAMVQIPGVFVNDTNQFLFDTNRDGNVDFVWNVADDVGRFTGLSGLPTDPSAGDLNLDGIDDIGLW